MTFFMFINVKIGILTFMSGKNNIFGLPEPVETKFLDIFIRMSILNFMLSWDEHENYFFNLGARSRVIHVLTGLNPLLQVT